MNVSVNDAGVCRKTIKIEVPAEKIAEERAETLKAYIQYANLPGFRKGKAPKHIVAKRYEKEITKEIQERVLPKYYQEALQQSELTVVGLIDVSEVELKDGEPLDFEVTVDVAPEFKLPKYEGISIKEEKNEITEEMVDGEVTALRNQSADFKDAEDHAVEEGDMAQLSYTATVDGKAIEEVAPEAKGIGSGEGYWVSADDNAFLPGMGKAIVGLNIGDKKDVEISFDESFVVKELAGITATYSIEVTGVRMRTLPEINEEFLSRFQMETEEDLRKAIHEEMERVAERNALSNKHEQIIKHLVAKTKIEVPQTVVENQTRNMIYDIAQQRLMAGETQDALAEQKDEIQKEAEERALENTKLRYIGLAIADELKFEATEVEVDEEIASIAIRQQKDARELRAEMEENNTLTSVSEQIRFNKALDYMVEKAKIK